MSEILPSVDLDALPAEAPADIFATPESELPAVPPPYESPFQIVEHTWTGTDGSVWHLSDPDRGVFIVQEDVEGLHLPMTDDINRESPSIAGSRFQGYRVKARDVVWPVYVYSDESSAAFYDLEARFFDSMRLGEYGTWRVTRPDGQFRELRMRPVPVSFSHSRDPGRFGWVQYPVRFLADENPFWTTPLEVPGSKSTFDSKVGENFYGGSAGVGPSFVISPTSAETSREIYNSGDEDAYSVITVRGPMDFVDFTIGKRRYHLECNLEAGQWIKVDTTPLNYSIKDWKGTNRMKSIDNWIFDPFPARKSTKVEVLAQGLGGGSVVFDIELLYHRAW
ncbi:UNVERIFIED_CONTAM: hypothetical protein IGO34_23080 [Salmonella enterica subsp. enterica serovar Weltevreden]